MRSIPAEPRGVEVRPLFQLGCEVGPLQRLETRIDSLPGDVVAWHTLAVADGAVVQRTPDDDVVGLRAQ